MLIERFNKNGGWERLEEAVLNAVIAGGVNSMTYFGEAVPLGSEPNPATLADHASTLAIIRVIEPYLDNICRENNCGYSYFGEEFAKKKIERKRGDSVSIGKCSYKCEKGL
jgi:hypothetical protein